MDEAGTEHGSAHQEHPCRYPGPATKARRCPVFATTDKETMPIWDHMLKYRTRELKGQDAPG